MSTTAKSGWRVVAAGTTINLALGVLYAWSIFKGAIKSSIEKGGPGAFQWDLASINDPYALCCLTFAFAMILAGKCQDKIGPAKTALIGGLLVGSGFSLMAFSNSYAAWVIGFGVLAGAGFGFGYSAATPPALKWFSPSKTGLIAGIVVAGFGLAPVYIAPLSSFLLGVFGIQKSMLMLAAGFTVVVCGMSFFVVNPPAGYVAPEPANPGPVAKLNAAKPVVNATVSEILRNYKFYVLWLAFFIGSGAGLMVIGSVAGLAKKSMGPMAFVAVAIMAVGNAAGRVVAGILSDKIGRRATLFIMLSLQAAMMFAAIPVVSTNNAALTCPARHFHRLQLRLQPLPLPFVCQGLLGHKKLRAQLRSTLYCLGCWRLCHGQSLRNAQCPAGRFIKIVCSCRDASGSRSRPYRIPCRIETCHC